MFQKLSLLIFIFGITNTLQTATDFKTEQLKHKRVKEAYLEKEADIKQLLKNNTIDSLSLFIRAFKAEEELEVWGKNTYNEHYKLLTSYSICWSPGDLGPKRKQGDYQVPEGFYSINVFNPESKFHLSLGIDYPNPSDRVLGSKQRLGGDIFIHGDCVSVGCIPITDECIKELYILTIEATHNGQLNIPVHLFPTRLTDTFIDDYNYEEYMDYNHTAFWKNIKKGYDYFEEHKTLPNITISETGAYIFN
jgi:murein L,D-transpeptidase YafK